MILYPNRTAVCYNLSIWLTYLLSLNFIMCCTVIIQLNLSDWIEPSVWDLLRVLLTWAGGVIQTVQGAGLIKESGT